MLLKERDEETGKGGAGAVEGVAELVLSFCILEPELHAAGLVVGEAGAARDFEILALAGSPYFDVVGFAGRESDVAGAKLDDLVVKAKLLESCFGMAGELFEQGEGLLGVDDLNELDFIKLVHADDTPVVTTGAAGFTAEAGGLGGELDGEIGLGEEGVAVKISDGNLGSGDEELLVVSNAIHVVFKLWKLAGAFHALSINEVGNIDFLVSVLVGLEIEEELNQGALEFGSFAAVDGISGAREAGAVIKANKPLGLGDFEVITGIEESWLFAPASDDGIGFLVLPDWAFRVGEIGDIQEKLGLAVACLGCFVVEGFDGVADLFHLGFDAGSVLTIGAEHSDFLGSLFALRLESLFPGFVLTTDFVACEHFGDEIGGAIVTICEAFFDEIRSFADELNVEHCGKGCGRVAVEGSRLPDFHCSGKGVFF